MFALYCKNTLFDFILIFLNLNINPKFYQTMEFNVICNKLNYLHEQISKKATGSPAELAKKLGVNERTVRRYIDKLREMGGEIIYCRNRQTYYYPNLLSFNINYQQLVEENGNSEIETIDPNCGNRGG
jgi:biotin operon repressor